MEVSGSENPTQLVETVASIINFFALFGPLPASLKALRTKNVDALPIVFIIVNTGSGIVWGVYSFNLQQKSLFLVNACGNYL